MARRSGERGVDFWYGERKSVSTIQPEEFVLTKEISKRIEYPNGN
jgi:hypothetical protein